jgi:hypothetical protein
VIIINPIIVDMNCDSGPNYVDAWSSNIKSSHYSLTMTPKLKTSTPIFFRSFRKLIQLLQKNTDIIDPLGAPCFLGKEKEKKLICLSEQLTTLYNQKLRIAVYSHPDPNNAKVARTSLFFVIFSVNSLSFSKFSSFTLKQTS